MPVPVAVTSHQRAQVTPPPAFHATRNRTDAIGVGPWADGAVIRVFRSFFNTHGGFP
jgi:hypothetical protein